MKIIFGQNEKYTEINIRVYRIILFEKLYIIIIRGEKLSKDVWPGTVKRISVIIEVRIFLPWGLDLI